MTSKIQWYTICIFVLAALAGMALFFPRDAYASAILVETTLDELDGASGNGDCSLREAVANANNDNGAQVDCNAGTGADTIVLPPGAYTLTGISREDGNLSGDLDISRSLTILGTDPMTTKIQAGTSSPVGSICFDCVDRVLEILTGADVTINNVTIRYGKAPNGTSSFIGASGGGIYNQGDLTLNGCVVTLNQSGHGWDNPSGNGGYAGSGGGVYTEGHLTVNNSRITYNQSGHGGEGGDGGYPKWGGHGGGVYAILESAVTLTNVFIGQNATGNGARGGDAPEGDAVDGERGGSGGGIFCGSCSLTMLNSSLISNVTGGGGTGGAVTGGNGDGGDGGKSGSGAGAYLNTGESMGILINSRIHDNQTGQGGLGGSGTGTGSAGSDGDRGSGGGLDIQDNAQAIITKSTISNNGAYDGGGIFNTNNPSTALVNTTISGNMADNNGGGIAIIDLVTMELTFVTVVSNTADYDGDGNGDGGGYSFTGYITLTNTIIANNVSVSYDNHDCLGGIISQDYNLLGISDSGGCYFTAQSNDLAGTTASPLDPVITALADNGGPTYTHALDITSPAVDQVPAGVNGCNSGTTKDQRGTIRFARCDIGAFEIDKGYHVYLPLVLR